MKKSACPAQKHEAPAKDCGTCPRLAGFRRENRAAFPLMFNAPVPSFGDDDPALLIVGLAPGLRGANFTGRPFTNDYAGDLLYPTLVKFGFASGIYDKRTNDGLELIDARITNAVRCVPPENKPLPAEIAACRPYLEQELQRFTRLKAIIALGTVAHQSVLKALGFTAAACKFGHDLHYTLAPKKNMQYPVTLIDSYHCSRYNVNTGRLTTEMFEAVVSRAKKICA